ncbi:hypothetical protein [Methanomethylophilus alvi]
MASNHDEPEEDHRSEEQIKADNNHANQLNPNNDAYWSSRSCSRR